MRVSFRSVFLAAVVSLAVVAIAIATAAAAPLERTVNESYIGAVTFESWDSTGSIVTDVTLWAAVGTITDTFTGVSNVSNLSMQITVYDNNVGIYLAFFQGQAQDFQFDYRNNLSAAHLTAIVPMYDLYWSSYTDYSVDLQWTARGRPVRNKQDGVQHQPGNITIIQHYTTVGQDCTCSGTVSDGTTNWTPEATEMSNLQNIIIETTATGQKQR